MNVMDRLEARVKASEQLRRVPGDKLYAVLKHRSRRGHETVQFYKLSSVAPDTPGWVVVAVGREIALICDVPYDQERQGVSLSSRFTTTDAIWTVNRRTGEALTLEWL